MRLLFEEYRQAVSSGFHRIWGDASILSLLTLSIGVNVHLLTHGPYERRTHVYTSEVSCVDGDVRVAVVCCCC